jgi:flavin reductase (DIM6/NTAB) family NADH-FMN oxidoreductase RutF
MQLRPTRSIALPDHRLWLFEPSGYENHCASPASLAMYDLRAKRRAALSTRRNPHNFKMSHADLRSSWVFYMCPRPVVLVTVEHEGQSNIFPMDLIGPTNSPWFTMALRSTSPAVRLMQQSRRMALASVPFAMQTLAYTLGKHHALASVDWATIPVTTAPSPLFGLPVPEAALRIREVRVREFHEVGSHVLFVTSIERETNTGRKGPQLFHRYSPWSDVTPDASLRTPSA